MKIEQKHKKYFWMVFVFIILLELLISVRPIFHDDALFAKVASDKTFLNKQNSHPPIANWIDIVFVSIFGYSNTAIRLTSLIFSSLTTVFVFFIAKKYFDEKTAYFSMIIMSVWAWHIRASQMMSGSDGGLFTFLTLLTVYFFMKFEEKPNFKNMICSGVALGLTVLVKESAILLYPIMCIYLLLRNIEKKQLFERAEGLFYSFMISAIPIVLFVVIDMLFNGSTTMTLIIQRLTVAGGSEVANFGYSILLTRLYSYFKIIFWLNPVILIFTILFFIKNNNYWRNAYLFDKSENHIFVKSVFVKSASFQHSNQNSSFKFSSYQYSFIRMFFSFIIILLPIYFIFVSPTQNIPRYLMVLIPFLSIFSASYISSFEFSKKNVALMLISVMFVFSIFTVLNANGIIVPFGNISTLKGNVFSDFKFYIPFFDENDSSGFLIIFLCIIIYFIFVGFLSLFAAYYENANKKKKSIQKNLGRFNKIKFIIMSLLILGIAFNFFVISEYAIHTTNPDYGDGVKQLTDYAMKTDLKEPIIILKNYELTFYLRHKYSIFTTDFGISENSPIKIKTFDSYLSANGGTIIFNDMPPIDRTGQFFRIIEKCEKIFSYTNKGYEISYIYDCSELKKDAPSLEATN